MFREIGLARRGGRTLLRDSSVWWAFSCEFEGCDELPNFFFLSKTHRGIAGRNDAVRAARGLFKYYNNCAMQESLMSVTVTRYTMTGQTADRVP